MTRRGKNRKDDDVNENEKDVFFSGCIASREFFCQKKSKGIWNAPHELVFKKGKSWI